MSPNNTFEELLRKKGIHMPMGAVLTRRNEPGPYKLSFAQHRIWFLQQFENTSAAYNDPTALQIIGPLNVIVLERALNEIMRRHDVLRMVFPAPEGQPIQVLLDHENAQIAITIILLNKWYEESSGKPGTEPGTDIIREFVNWFSSRPFDLSRDLLVRAALLKIGEEEHVLVVNIHHIVMDGWSKGIILQELMALYETLSNETPSTLGELPFQYTDYVHWHHEWIQGKIFESQMAYWKEKLKGAPPTLELPLDYPRPNLPSGKGSLELFSVSMKKLQALNHLARQEEVTLFMVLVSVYNILLYRYSGKEDILIGVPVAGRQRVELEKLIGLFVNTFIIRTDLAGRPTFKTLLGRVRAAALEAYAHQDIPFEKLVEELNPQRNLSITPLFQVMFQLQNAPMPPARIQGLTITPIQINTGFSQTDLSLTMWEEEGIMKEDGEVLTDQNLIKKEVSTKWINTLQIGSKTISADLSAYVNSIANYVFLRPVGSRETISGYFPVWKYEQTDALLAGADLLVSWAISKTITASGK
ncbi:MAG: condensation domain-containing protein, partial [Acidobacteria bacterium]|nr:condensation domain-containing protein [Acidobacteriota bacterium]